MNKTKLYQPPWLQAQIRSENMDVVSVLLIQFDPQNTMDPGATPGLDMNEEQREKNGE